MSSNRYNVTNVIDESGEIGHSEGIHDQCEEKLHTKLWLKNPWHGVAAASWIDSDRFVKQAQGKERHDLNKWMQGSTVGV